MSDHAQCGCEQSLRLGYERGRLAGELERAQAKMAEAALEIELMNAALDEHARALAENRRFLIEYVAAHDAAAERARIVELLRWIGGGVRAGGVDTLSHVADAVEAGARVGDIWVRLEREVRSDPSMYRDAPPDRVAPPGLYRCQMNRHGAVMILVAPGVPLGLKPGEFVFCEGPAQGREGKVGGP